MLESYFDSLLRLNFFVVGRMPPSKDLSLSSAGDAGIADLLKTLSFLSFIRFLAGAPYMRLTICMLDAKLRVPE